MTDMTVKELYEILGEIVEDYGDLEVLISYDSGLVATTIKNKSPIFIEQPMSEYCKIRFEGY